MERKATWDDVDSLVAQQGWNEESLNVLYNMFVDKNDLLEALYSFLSDQADFENKEFEEDDHEI